MRHVQGRFATREEVAVMKAEAAAGIVANEEPGSIPGSPFTGMPSFEELRVPVLGMA